MRPRCIVCGKPAVRGWRVCGAKCAAEWRIDAESAGYLEPDVSGHQRPPEPDPYADPDDPVRVPDDSSLPELAPSGIPQYDADLTEYDIFERKEPVDEA